MQQLEEKRAWSLGCKQFVDLRYPISLDWTLALLLYGMTVRRDKNKTYRSTPKQHNTTSTEQWNNQIAVPEHENATSSTDYSTILALCDQMGRADASEEISTALVLSSIELRQPEHNCWLQPDYQSRTADLASHLSATTDPRERDP